MPIRILLVEDDAHICNTVKTFLSEAGRSGLGLTIVRNANGSLRLREIVYNIFLFIPLGVYICMLKGEWSFIKNAHGYRSILIV